MRYLLLLIMFPFLSLATSVNISSEVLTVNKAKDFGINRLIWGKQSNWLVLVYPHQTNDGLELTDIVVTISESGERIVSLPAQIRGFEITPWKRLDVEFEKQAKRILKVEITYGEKSFVVENVMNLVPVEYELFKEQYDKEIK